MTGRDLARVLAHSQAEPPARMVLAVIAWHAAPSTERARLDRHQLADEAGVFLRPLDVLTSRLVELGELESCSLTWDECPALANPLDWREWRVALACPLSCTDRPAHGAAS